MNSSRFPAVLFCSFDRGRLEIRSGSCSQRHAPAPELSLSVLGTIFASLAIVVALILLPSIAFADPPDQLWIAGIYDGADGDDIVTLVYESAGVEAASQQPFLPPPCLSERFLVSGPRRVDGVPAIQFARGPPSSLTSIFYAASSCLQLLPPVVQFQGQRRPTPTGTTRQ